MELEQTTKYGTVCRPGGLALTARMIKLCGLKKGDCIADIGCGTGTTVAYLKDEFRIKGIEIDTDKIKTAKEKGLDILYASAADMPFADDELDGIIFECSFSKMNAEPVLAQAYRVLKKGGKIAFSDFYAKNEPYQFTNLLGRCDTMELWKQRLEMAGFNVLTTEDYSKLLPIMWTQLVAEQGKENIYQNIGVTKEKLKQINCGYCVIIAQKRG